MERTILSYIEKLPVGYSVVWYHKKKYGVSRTDYNDGKSIKVYAEELGGTDIISLNYYKTSKTEVLKPCEMPEMKVIDFLTGCKLIKWD
ncbi:peptide methionine sulfoxide reductase [Marixanthomonas ophiurae]|uniref:Peptide methionine sulfoxide reductase n=1 Tax=Marixanthomonas ophiurae TaxID=387659 RepID=A0A3E1Q7Q6_9FLAO|nr:peptide methionine sulfoxide reductase [Marixanthomonas ophiurae]RFN58173.1 peptide methionine sulfoxide reductase [Marixanthomonas ophiurae]